MSEIKEKTEKKEKFFSIPQTELTSFRGYYPDECSEKWTNDKDINEVMVDTLGYIPLDKQVQRLIEAGENLIVTRLKEGTYSNDFDDNEFHESPLDDLALLSYDELVNLQKETKSNFYTKKAVLSKLIKDKKEIIDNLVKDEKNNNDSETKKEE